MRLRAAAVMKTSVSLSDGLTPSASAEDADQQRQAQTAGRSNLSEVKMNYGAAASTDQLQFVDRGSSEEGKWQLWTILVLIKWTVSEATRSHHVHTEEAFECTHLSSRCFKCLNETDLMTQETLAMWTGQLVMGLLV